jgi:hypothetical protein
MAEASAHAAAIAQAIKASGVVVRVDPGAFMRILNRMQDPLIVVARGGFFQRGWRYLTVYKGLAFHTKCPDPLLLPGRAEVIEANSIWVPS